LRAAFDQFEPEKVARYRRAKIERLLVDSRIIRNRAKVEAAVSNARAFLAIQETGSFSDYLWQFVGGETIHHRFRSIKRIPAQSRESRAMARDLKSRGFRFCGPTITYAFMQAVGMVNDHLVSCFRHAEIASFNSR
jgi:DNA-3-methyladenine glycosylase I